MNVKVYGYTGWYAIKFKVKIFFEGKEIGEVGYKDVFETKIEKDGELEFRCTVRKAKVYVYKNKNNVIQLEFDRFTGKLVAEPKQDDEDSFVCSECGNVISGDVNKCPYCGEEFDDEIEESYEISNLPRNYHEMKTNVKYSSLIKSIAFLFGLGLICMVLYFIASTGNFDKDPYGKVFKYTYETYGEKLNMYFIIKGNKCQYAVGNPSNVTNTCSISQNRSGDYILYLDSERYEYTNGNFECLNCSDKVVFKFFRKTDE